MFSIVKSNKKCFAYRRWVFALEDVNLEDLLFRRCRQIVEDGLCGSLFLNKGYFTPGGFVLLGLEFEVVTYNTNVPVFTSDLLYAPRDITVDISVYYEETLYVILEQSRSRAHVVCGSGVVAS